VNGGKSGDVKGGPVKTGRREERRHEGP